MDYITENLIDIYKERFSQDKPYLNEKLQELKKHKNKYDGLNFLCTKADKITIQMYVDKTQLTTDEIMFLKSIWSKM